MVVVVLTVVVTIVMTTVERLEVLMVTKAVTGTTLLENDRRALTLGSRESGRFRGIARSEWYRKVTGECSTSGDIQRVSDG